MGWITGVRLAPWAELDLPPPSHARSSAHGAHCSQSRSWQEEEVQNPDNGHLAATTGTSHSAGLLAMVLLGLQCCGSHPGTWLSTGRRSTIAARIRAKISGPDDPARWARSCLQALHLISLSLSLVKPPLQTHCICGHAGSHLGALLNCILLEICSSFKAEPIRAVSAQVSSRPSGERRGKRRSVFTVSTLQTSALSFKIPHSYTQNSISKSPSVLLVKQTGMERCVITCQVLSVACLP